VWQVWSTTKDSGFECLQFTHATAAMKTSKGGVVITLLMALHTAQALLPAKTVLVRRAPSRSSSASGHHRARHMRMVGINFYSMPQEEFNTYVSADACGCWCAACVVAHQVWELTHCMLLQSARLCLYNASACCV
jgi:hypothetical protein